MPRIPSRFTMYSLMLVIWLRVRVGDMGRHIHSIIFVQSMYFTRLLIGVSSLTWSLCLYPDTVVFAEHRTAYVVMHAIMEEAYWAILFLVSGVSSILSVALDIRNRYTLLFDALLNCLLWTASTLAILAAFWPHDTVGWFDQLKGYPAPVALSGGFWLTIASWWHFVRQMTDSKMQNRCVCESACPYITNNQEGRINVSCRNSSYPGE